jgi:hypothetical protein
VALTIEHGSGGALLAGRRVMTELGTWQAASRDEGGLRVTVLRHDPDPFTWEHPEGALAAELVVGKAVWSGPAHLESREPLVFILEEVR